MTRTERSACPLDCPDSCSLEVTVEDGRVTRLEGDRRNPFTAGFICSKVRHFPEHLYGEERLLRPALRRGAKGDGGFAPLSWDEALDHIAERMRESLRRRGGGEGILPLFYGGSNGLLTQGTTDARLFHRLGASRMARTVCAATSGRAAAGLYGKMPGVAPEDYTESRLIVLWGVNPSASGIHLVPVIEEARRRGARLVVIDPRRTQLAKRADLHLQLRPGTDLPLALSVIRFLFEEEGADHAFLAAHATGAAELRRRARAWTFERAAGEAGVAAADLEAFARFYAAAEPAVVRCGWGVERNRNGGSATAAVLALPAVAGKFGRRGGGYTLSNSAAWNLADAAGEGPPATRVINMNRVGRALLEADDPPIDVLFVYNCNPLMTLPNQELVRRGLLREDLFTVVFDQVKTDTARYADLLLPATTFLEHHDLPRGYGAMVLHRMAPVLPPVGEARPNYRVFADLLHRLDLARPGEAEEPEELIALALGEGEEGRRVRRAWAEHGLAPPSFGPRPVQMVDVHPRTPDGKIHLLRRELDREVPGGLYRYRPDPAAARPGGATYPLALISPSSHRTISSTLGQLHRRQVPVELHPDDAAARSIAGGDEVRVFNELGEVRCLARLSPDLRQGVAMLPKGLWSHNTLNGATANALCPDDLNDLAGGACFNDARVEVERL